MSEFVRSPTPRVVASLRESFPDSSLEEVASWKTSVPTLQTACAGLNHDLAAVRDAAVILEYTLPSEEGRCDAIVLSDGLVGVVEFKGKSYPAEDDLDQVRGYYRELRWNHTECRPPRRVIPILVPLRSPPIQTMDDEVYITNPGGLPDLLNRIIHESEPTTPLPAFVSPDVARAAPGIVAAARALFNESALPRLKRSLADTESTVERVVSVSRQSAGREERRVVFVSGIPGSGKTLVGLRLAHTQSLDDLISPRGGRTPPSPVLYLSGNGPLVKVLRHELRSVAGGRTLVGDVMAWILSQSGAAGTAPPDQHVIVFDEAQRAWDAQRMQEKHGHRGLGISGSEPETLLKLLEEAPRWSVVVALIGQGQAIHTGEEGGLPLWADAIKARQNAGWRVSAPPWIARIMRQSGVESEEDPLLQLEVARRQVFAESYGKLIDALLNGATVSQCAALGRQVRSELEPGAADCEPFHLCVSRQLPAAKRHVRREVSPGSGGLAGLLVSSKDRLMEGRYGVRSNLFFSGGLTEIEWFAPATESPNSCTWLQNGASEFQIQGLELDVAIVCWGSDLAWTGSTWDTSRAKGYKPGTRILDPRSLRINAYRVLLTRGRRGSVVFVPPERELDSTFERLVGAGFRDITPKAI